LQTLLVLPPRLEKLLSLFSFSSRSHYKSILAERHWMPSWTGVPVGCNLAMAAAANLAHRLQPRLLLQDDPTMGAFFP
jgi:hypothetical protein